MSRTLREIANELVGMVAELRDIAARVDGPGDGRWAIARDLRATAFNLERQASWAEKVGTAAGEPDPSAPPAWVSQAAPGELQEVWGK